jgi:anaerobic selenocysteine-containing dehydrogenase
MHPDDADKLEVKEGDMLALSSRRGEMVVPARLSDSVQLGNLFLPIHFGENPSNVLTSSDAVDPVAKIPEFKVSAVRIRKLDESY